MAACVVLLLITPLFAETPLGDLSMVERLQSTLTKIAEDVRPSVVAIRARRSPDDGETRGNAPDDAPSRPNRRRLIPAVGSGVIIRENGLILTNEHVVHNADPQDIEVLLFDGSVYAVDGITSDPRSDLAVLTIQGKGLRSAGFGDLSEVRQGHFAIVMGNPFGTASDNRGRAAMSFGVVSAIGQVLTDQLDPSRERYYGNLIQTDAKINPGNSGGPLLNIRGEIIGVNTAISTRSGANEGVGYAIPIDHVTKALIEQLVRGQEVEYGLLGVRLSAPSNADCRAAGAPPGRGARITDVEFGTPAHQADLRPGDIVVEYDGEPIEEVDELVRMVGASRAGVEVDLVFFRAGQRSTLKVAPARREVLTGVNILTFRGMKLASPSDQILRSYRLPETVKGLVVTHVEDNSPAGKAGVEAGQVIRRIGAWDMAGVQDLRRHLSNLSGPLKILLNDEPPTELTLP